MLIFGKRVVCLGGGSMQSLLLLLQHLLQKKIIAATNRELVPSSFKSFTLVQVPHIHWLLSFEASTCSFTWSRFWLGHYMLIWGTIVIYQDHFCDKTAAGITGQNGWVRCYDRFKAKISDRRLTIKDGFLLIQRFKEGYFRTVLYAIGCFDFGELQRWAIKRIEAG